MRTTIAALALGLVLLGSAGSALAESADAKALIREAATEVSYLSFDKAFPLFAKAQRVAAEGSEDWQAAVFGQAVCMHQSSPVTTANLQQAVALYSSLIERHPQGKYTPQAMMAMGRIDELVDYLDDVPDRAGAREWYAKAREAAGVNSDLAHEATLRIAGTYIQTFDHDQVRTGVKLLKDWLEEHPNNPLASAMWQYAGDALFYPLGEKKVAVAAYVEADKLGLLEEGREGPLYWRMANLAEQVGDEPRAIEYYTKIIVKTPTSGKAYESQLALKRLGAEVPPIRLFQRSAAAQAQSAGGEAK